MKKMKCGLDPELHDCDCLIRDTLECTKGSYCQFRDPYDQPKPTLKEKWFEKYYTDTRRMM